MSEETLSPGELAIDLRPIGEDHGEVHEIKLVLAELLDSMRYIAENAKLEGTQYLAKVAATLVFEASEAAIEATRVFYSGRD